MREWEQLIVEACILKRNYTPMEKEYNEVRERVKQIWLTDNIEKAEVTHLTAGPSAM